MRIESKGFILRPWHVSDAEALVKIANNKAIANNMSDRFPSPYTLDDAVQWLEFAMQINIGFTKYFAIEMNKELIGSIGLTMNEDIYRKNAELGYYLGQKYWNRGIISQAIRDVIKYAFETFDIIKIYAQPFAYNMASRRTLEKAEFICEAILKDHVFKNEQFVDCCIYSIWKKNVALNKKNYGTLTD
jgi:[ribosomal protein S5]-alanine N-acetyltransferase